MELSTAIRERRSIRKFKPAEVSPELITEIFNEARWSPSWGNTQPWEFYVLTGPVLARFKEINIAKHVSGEPISPDVQMPENWPPSMKTRYNDLGKVVLTTLGIKREDRELRDKYYQDMASLFGAPCLLLACIFRNAVAEYPMLDIGLITQTICLLAHDKGLGTCILAAAARYPDAIRKITSIPEDRKIIAGIALGYPDLTFPLNNIDRQRAEISEFVHWMK
ncbi:MAG: nitroreductase [Smithellaceae bacterium]